MNGKGLKRNILSANVRLSSRNFSTDNPGMEPLDIVGGTTFSFSENGCHAAPVTSSVPG